MEKARYTTTLEIKDEDTHKRVSKYLSIFCPYIGHNDKDRKNNIQFYHFDKDGEKIIRVIKKDRVEISDKVSGEIIDAIKEILNGGRNN